MTTQEILNQQATKTRKMEMLFELGMSRQEVARVMGVNYGFAQNVYQKYYRTGRFAIAIDSNFTFNFNRKFGIEIECLGNRNQIAREITRLGVQTISEGYNHTTRNYWKVIYDSSLRATGNLESVEIVSPPLQGEEGLRQLQIVCQALKNCNAKINKTCGLHIHLEAQDLKLKNWKTLIINYLNSENTIDSFMPNSRRENNNQFCKGLNTTKQRINLASNLNQIKNLINNGSRYSKVNLNSFWKYKTVEFRQHSGTIEFDKIQNWILFLARLVEFSKRNMEIENGNLEDFSQFLPTEIIEFYKNRKQKLAA